MLWYDALFRSLALEQEQIAAGVVDWIAVHGVSGSMKVVFIVATCCSGIGVEGYSIHQQIKGNDVPCDA